MEERKKQIALNKLNKREHLVQLFSAMVGRRDQDVYKINMLCSERAHIFMWVCL